MICESANHLAVAYIMGVPVPGISLQYVMLAIVLTRAKTKL